MESANQKPEYERHAVWADRRVLIIGGTGFLGLRLSHRLVELQALVTATVCEQDQTAQIEALPQEVRRKYADVRKLNQVQELIGTVEPEFIFHLAAVGVNEPFIAEQEALHVNVCGTLNTLRAVQEIGNRSALQPRRVVVAGTSYEYGAKGRLDPGNVYAASKVAAWAFCRMHYRAYGTPVVVARPFNVYGPGQTERALIPSAIQAAQNDQSFPTTPGEQRRDFVFVDDVIDGFLAVAAADGVEGESLDLGTGIATSVRDVVESVFKFCGGLGRPRIGALPYRPGVVWETVADASRTKESTGWQAKTNLSEGLTKTIQAFSVT